MATIEKITGKAGVSYRITVSGALTPQASVSAIE